MPRLCYSLQATHFQAAELDSVQAQFMSQFLQASHFPSHFSRAIVYAPIIIGGLGLLRLFYEQCAAQIKTMIGLLRTDSELSKLFRINLDIFRLRAGTSKCPMSDPWEINYMHPDWFVSVCLALAQSGLCLSTKNPEYFRLKCDGDKNIMDELISAELPKRWLTACNRCRIYIQAITVSDIADPLGIRIPRHVLECRNRLPSRLEWPIQAWPLQRDCTIWQRALLKVFLTRG